jgi:hypothetical protein
VLAHDDDGVDLTTKTVWVVRHSEAVLSRESHGALPVSIKDSKRPSVEAVNA